MSALAVACLAMAGLAAAQPTVSPLPPTQLLGTVAPATTAAAATTAPTTAAATTAAGVSSSQNDLNTLNYALTLEHLEASFYNQFQAQFNGSSFAAAGFPAESYSYLSLIQSHENAHVQLLTSAIQSAGGSAVAACNYSFPVTSVATYLAYARVFENTGVEAYDGAINTLTNTALQQVAATIATVEARHAAFLNELNVQIPFPNVTDSALAPATIAGIVTPFITSCPSSLTLPVERNATNNYQAVNATASDIATLQYALTLEHLESTFYNLYQSQFSDAAFVAAGFASGIYSYLSLIQYHEASHVALLSSVISSLGGSPVPACNYSFPVTNVTSYIAVAQALENTGVMAYDGAVNTISSVILQQAAATIATVEARHAAFLNGLDGVSPFPNVTDSADTPSQIAAIAGQFITSCPYDLAAAIAAVKVPS